GFSVVGARDGREAYKALQDDVGFTAAVFDVVMPEIAGPELVRYMRTEKRFMKIPVMMMTAEQDPKLPTASFAAGAVAFLPKPLPPALNLASRGLSLLEIIPIFRQQFEIQSKRRSEIMLKRCLVISLLATLFVGAGFLVGRARAAGNLSPGEARRVIARMAGIQLPSDAVRVKDISMAGNS